MVLEQVLAALTQSPAFVEDHLRLADRCVGTFVDMAQKGHPLAKILLTPTEKLNIKDVDAIEKDGDPFCLEHAISWYTMQAGEALGRNDKKAFTHIKEAYARVADAQIKGFEKRGAAEDLELAATVARTTNVLIPDEKYDKVQLRAYKRLMAMESMHGYIVAEEIASRLNDTVRLRAAQNAGYSLALKSKELKDMMEGARFALNLQDKAKHSKVLRYMFANVPFDTTEHLIIKMQIAETLSDAKKAYEVFEAAKSVRRDDPHLDHVVGGIGALAHKLQDKHPDAHFAGHATAYDLIIGSKHPLHIKLAIAMAKCMGDNERLDRAFNVLKDEYKTS